MYGTKFSVYTQLFHHGTTMPAKSDDESKNMSNLRLQLRPGDNYGPLAHLGSSPDRGHLCVHHWCRPAAPAGLRHALRGRRHCMAREVPQAADEMIKEGTRGLGYDPLARRGPSAAWTVSALSLRLPSLRNIRVSNRAAGHVRTKSRTWKPARSVV